MNKPITNLATAMSDKSKEILDKLGITEKEFFNFVLKMKPPFDNVYNRVLSEEEKSIFTKQAMGLLYYLLQNNSINDDMFEEIVHICVQFESLSKRKIDYTFLESVIDRIVISRMAAVDLRAIYDLVNKSKGISGYKNFN